MKTQVQKRLSNIYSAFVSEIRESFSDAGTVLIFFVAMVLYPMLYSVGYINQTIRDIPVAVIDQDHSSLSRQYTRMLDATEQLNVRYRPGSLKEAEKLFFNGDIHGVILIPQNFSKEILGRRQADVTVYCDAGKFFVYKQVFTAASFSTATFNAGVEIRSLMSKGRSWDEALDKFEGLSARFYDLYNPSSGYCTFIVPGILIIVIQQSLLVGIGLLFGKNNERRKLRPGRGDACRENSAPEDVLGKSFAYVTLYLFTSLLTLLLLYHWLSFPERGGFFQVYLLLLPFLLAVSFLGIAIGAWFNKRVHPLMFIVFISPMVFFLTGVAWPFESLPRMLQILAYAFPTTPMIPAFIKLRLIGGGVQSVTRELLVLLIQMTVYFFLAVFSCRYALKQSDTKKALVSG
jgi:ABC-2 type transport system permease protein